MHLPSYSPELNLIEKFWALVKRKIKRGRMITEENLSSRIADACNQILISDLYSFASHSKHQIIILLVNFFFLAKWSCYNVQSESKSITWLTKNDNMTFSQNNDISFSSSDNIFFKERQWSPCLFIFVMWNKHERVSFHDFIYGDLHLYFKWAFYRFKIILFFFSHLCFARNVKNKKVFLMWCWKMDLWTILFFLFATIHIACFFIK